MTEALIVREVEHTNPEDMWLVILYLLAVVMCLALEKKLKIQLQHVF